MLRCAFFHNIVGVSALVGRSSLELFLLPCITQALTGKITVHGSCSVANCILDEEEFVIEKAVSSLSCLCEVGLFRKHILLEIVHKTASLLIHPNTWIRYGMLIVTNVKFNTTTGAIAIMDAVRKQFGSADIHCFVLPTIRPFLICDILDITQNNVMMSLIPPVSCSPMIGFGDFSILKLQAVILRRCCSVRLSTWA